MYYLHFIKLEKDSISFLMDESGLGLACTFNDKSFAKEILSKLKIKAEPIEFIVHPVRCYYFSEYLENEEEWEDRWPVIWKCKILFKTDQIRLTDVKTNIFVKTNDSVNKIDQPSNPTTKLPLIIVTNSEQKHLLQDCMEELSNNALIKNVDHIRFQKLNNNNVAYSLQFDIGEFNEAEFNYKSNEIKHIIDVCTKYGATHHYDFEEDF